MLNGINAALSGLVAFQKKAEVAANNTANIESDGFKKDQVTLSEGVRPGGGVTASVEKVNSPGPQVYEQTANGMELVEKSNVDPGEELPNMMLTRRYFQANVKAIQIQDEMLGSLLDIKS